MNYTGRAPSFSLFVFIAVSGNGYFHFSHFSHFSFFSLCARAVQSLVRFLVLFLSTRMCRKKRKKRKKRILEFSICLSWVFYNRNYWSKLLGWSNFYISHFSLIYIKWEKWENEKKLLPDCNEKAGRTPLAPYLLLLVCHKLYICLISSALARLSYRVRMMTHHR